jgi:DNA-binding transcriptional regulator YiaG
VLDVELISRDLMRALRGRRSQPAFSRLLGFRSNAAYAWEHGRRYPEASLFLKAALRDRDLREELCRFFDEPEESFAGRRAFAPRTVMALVRKLVGSTPKSTLADQLSVDRTTLARWCNGKTEPRLPAFLSLVQQSTQRLLEFSALFADISQLPSMREVYTHSLRQRRLAYERPLSHAVLRALELDAYRNGAKHDVVSLSVELGIEPQEVETYLADLEAAGQATRTGQHYRVAEILTIDTREDPDQNQKLKAFWAREALRRFEARQAGPDTLFSFNLFAISEPGFQKIRRLHLAYYDQVRAIIEQSESADRVVVMNLQLLPMRRPDAPADI